MSSLVLAGVEVEVIGIGRCARFHLSAFNFLNYASIAPLIVISVQHRAARLDRTSCRLSVNDIKLFFLFPFP